MHEERYPTSEEFWRRLRLRGVEPDLQAALRARLKREEMPIGRAGDSALIMAVAARLLPGWVPPAALGAALDEFFDKQLGRADDKAGLLPRSRLIPEGFAKLDEEAQRRHGHPFAALAHDDQDVLLAEAEDGRLQGPEGFESGYWFKRVRELFLLAYGSDPRGMVQMGYPGPPYKPGHIWLDEGEIAARARRRLGYLEL